jgi:1-acyl-sn-glycerol-3-phosphate acyltransferase
LTAAHRQTSLARHPDPAASVTRFRSILWFVYFLIVSAVMHVAALPTLILPRKALVRTSQAWSRVLLWGLKAIAGLGYEVRGEIPKGAVLVAAKHMSMWDTLAFYMLLDDAVVVLKRELLAIPFYGWYVRKAHMIPIDRASGGSALRQMAVRAREVAGQGRPIVIFPEGTRKKPGARPSYKPGVAGLYTHVGLPCVPVALNSGQYWTGFLKRRGTIVVEFLPAIPAGLKRAAFMAELQERIETATARLLAEGNNALKDNR